MKLIYKNILAGIISSVIIISVSQIITYNFRVYKIIQEAREHLNSERIDVEDKIKKGFAVENFKNNIGDEVRVKEIPYLTGRGAFFKKTHAEEKYEESEEETEEEDITAQAIVFECASPLKNYQVTIIKIQDNDEELGKSILYSGTLAAVLIVITLALANYFIYSRIWRPFYSTLRIIQNFNLSKQNKVVFFDSGTKEFNDLNKALRLMADKISRDYRVLKEFTENASHEIQTPLAVIQSKIEMCLQDERLTQEQAGLLMEASNAVHALVQINKGLITLTKLDNNQVDLPEDIDVYEIIHNRLHLFEDFIEEKGLDVHLDLEKNVRIRINPSLAGILFDNLIKNAIKHNVQGGKISMKLSAGQFTISNTGHTSKIKDDKLFDRFYKAGSGGSLGLGLAIVKKICEVYQLSVHYHFTEGWHQFQLKFPVT